MIASRHSPIALRAREYRSSITRHPADVQNKLDLFSFSWFLGMMFAVYDFTFAVIEIWPSLNRQIASDIKPIIIVTLRHQKIIHCFIFGNNARVVVIKSVHQTR